MDTPNKKEYILLDIEMLARLLELGFADAERHKEALALLADKMAALVSEIKG